ncbi:MAG: DUF4169 family protein [Hellea sp.]
MNDNVVNFNKVRKSKARHKKVLRAAENRVKFGMKKSEKEKALALTKKLQGHLDGHKMNEDKTDGPETNTQKSDD